MEIQRGNTSRACCFHLVLNPFKSSSFVTTQVRSKQTHTDVFFGKNARFLCFHRWSRGPPPSTRHRHVCPVHRIHPLAGNSQSPMGPSREPNPTFTTPVALHTSAERDLYRDQAYGGDGEESPVDLLACSISPLQGTAPEKPTARCREAARSGTAFG